MISTRLESPLTALPSRGRLSLPALARTLLMGVVIFSISSPGQGQSSPDATDARSVQPLPTPALTSQLGTQDYIISPDDLLDVHVFDVAEVSRQCRVGPRGSIALPLLSEPITAAGNTPGQLSQLIEKKLQTAGFVSHPQVTVEVKESRLNSITVTGAVRKPQIYPVFARTTLLDVLSQAEGLTDEAGSTATITRGEVAVRNLASETRENAAGRQDSADQTLTVNLKRLLETGDPSLNNVLYPGDRVTVHSSGIIYVVGGVNRSGGFPMKNAREEMTVLKAVALAENLKSTAARKKALIIRRDPNLGGQRTEIPVNLAHVFEGRTPDLPLQSEDILFIPESGTKKVLGRASEAAIQLATGVIIWRR